MNIYGTLISAVVLISSPSLATGATSEKQLSFVFGVVQADAVWEPKQFKLWSGVSMKHE
ncbi:MAG: hypothetical protein WDM92_02000 [Caulobacteraceae bacterium]